MKLQIIYLSKTCSNGVHTLLLRSNSTGKSALIHFSLLVSSIVILLLVGRNAYAQEKTGEIDKIFGWATPATPGCVCAVSQNGKVVVNRAYGLADLERDVPLTTNSIFDAASLTKQFVAAAVLLLVEEKRLSLSDDIRKYIPELPDYGYKITVDHLLTHTSGLRDWTWIAQAAAGSADALTVVLRQRSLDFAPGEEWSYSNSGYVLLKEMIARISRMPFDDFTRKRLFDPLGMKATQYLGDLREVVKNRALAYDKKGGRWKLDMALDNDRGGGGALLSTAGDLLIWNEALTGGRLGAFVTEKLQEPATLNNGRKLGYARGLFLNTNRGGKVIWHTGGSSGYGSLLSRFPESGLSIAILCNSGETGDRMAFARRIFDLFVPSTDPQMAQDKASDAVADSAGLAGSDLNSKAGLFFSERTGEPLRLVINNGRLGVAGGTALVPVAKDRFRNPRGALAFMSGDEFELHFLSHDQFELKSMEGKTTSYRRAQPYAPTSADLTAFAGRYESNEIGSVYQITAGQDGLVISLEHSPANKLEFKPVYRDAFQAGRMMVHFRRDKAGKVVTLDYSNPVIRNVKFTRLGDGTSR